MAVLEVQGTTVLPTFASPKVIAVSPFLRLLVSIIQQTPRY